jgi:hypothetical protein
MLDLALSQIARHACQLPITPDHTEYITSPHISPLSPRTLRRSMALFTPRRSNARSPYVTQRSLTPVSFLTRHTHTITHSRRNPSVFPIARHAAAAVPSDARTRDADPIGVFAAVRVRAIKVTACTVPASPVHTRRASFSSSAISAKLLCAARSIGRLPLASAIAGDAL